MIISRNDMLYAFSFALDCVENELLGVTSNHSKRVAYICIVLGKKLGFDLNSLLNLAACAILHDNALTEYIEEEYSEGNDVVANTGQIRLGTHCSMGERNLRELNFGKDTEGAILYHHENADGTGPFGKLDNQVSLYARLIHLGDMVDATFHLDQMTQERYNKVRNYVTEKKGSLFSNDLVDLFLESFTCSKMMEFKTKEIGSLLNMELPNISREHSKEEIIGFSTMFARIVDYKSHFTKEHSVGVAKKAVQMGQYYGYDEEKLIKLYFAGALHDIGKLAVNTEILEKAGKLTKEEYLHIQSHALYTYEILSKVSGLGEVVGWASYHHEKLNGTGYPFGKTAEELGMEERLMACIDIYQALIEKRPYKEGFQQKTVLKMMRALANKGELDSKIVTDIGIVFAE
ncbi:MAG: HD domain-containing protein [Lachnospiraceae bacterium]